MRTRAILALLAQLLAGAAAAAEADLAIVGLIAPREVEAGERFTIVARVRNDGPDHSTNAVVQIRPEFFGISMTAPAGWTCDARRLTCRAASMMRFTEASFEVTVLGPSIAGETMISVAASSSIADPRANNNEATVPLRVSAADATSELSIAMQAVEDVVAPGGVGRIAVTVRNDGPDAARNVQLAFDSELTAHAEGPGWTCTALLCTRASLAAGETASAEVRVTAPDRELVTVIHGRVQAENGNETRTQDNVAAAEVSIGSASAWQRILLPLTASNIAGAGGSMWKTDVAMLILADVPPELHPAPPPVPVRRPFDAHDSGLIVDPSTPGQFIYVRPADADKVRFSTRAYDLARSNETAGAEIPAVRERELRTSAISLLNVRIAPQYRHTLRIYDADARDGAMVTVRLFAGSETEPRVSRTLTLQTSPRRTTTARLPVHPGYAQLDLGSMIDLAEIDELRVDVEPATPGLRFWAFVSITNNATHHVTTVTPH